MGWLLLLGQSAYCQTSYPERALKLVVPFPATGSPDIYGTQRTTKLVKVMQALSPPSLTDNVAMEVAQSLATLLGQPVDFDRHPRGKTVAGTRHAALARPDGHTLLFAGNPTITIFPSLYRRLPFDPRRDLVPVAALARLPIVLITASDDPARTVRQVIERARFIPGQVNYAAVGDGSTSHLAGELFRSTVGIEIVNVNYNGSNSAINAVVTRNVEFGFVPLAGVLPFVEGGKVRVIAVASAQRHPAVPKVPTIDESGLPDFEASGWFGVFAPARTSAAIVSLLNYEINRVLAEEALQRSLHRQGLVPAPGTAEEFRALIDTDSARWGRLVKTAIINRYTGASGNGK